MALRRSKPEFLKESFNCPYCGLIAQQDWVDIISLGKIRKEEERPLIGVRGKRKIVFRVIPVEHAVASHIKFSICQNCKEAAIWYNGELIYPLASSLAPEPHEALPDELKREYDEARRVLSESPRSAAALLRLVVEKLIVSYGGEGRNLNDSINDLCNKKKLPRNIKKALHAVRIIGNNAVHPGSLDINDNRKIVVKLFDVVNTIVAYLVEQKQDVIEELYRELPEDKRRVIEENLGE